MENKIKPVHIIHLFLYAPVSPNLNSFAVPIYGRTKLMKAMFLFDKEYFKAFKAKMFQGTFKFDAYNYGPFSKDVIEALDFLTSMDCIFCDDIDPKEIDADDIELDEKISCEDANINTVLESNPFYSQKFCLTRRGKDLMEDKNIFFSWEKLNNAQKEILVNLKTQIVNTPLRQILIYVYSKYPEYAKKSKILNSLMNNI